jgi:glucose-fructose oxidoreductase
MSVEISRRAALIGIGAVLTQPLACARAIRAKPVGWAVLGLGSYATNEIMPSFAHSTSSKLVGLISGHPDKLKRFGDQYGIAESHRYTYDSMDAIASNPDIEVVYVITPPATHPEFAIRAAKLGKHVCSEKPMAPTPADCERMIEACRKAGKLLQIGYRCHYENHNLRAIQACRSGEIGSIRTIRSDHGFNMGAGTWRTQKALAGGGSMMDIGIYSLNALRYLSGEEPIEVSATITNPPNDPRFVDVEDTVHFTLTFPSGLVGYGTSGYSWVDGKNRYEVEGSKGKLLAEPATAYEGDTLTFNGSEITVMTNNQWAAQMDHMSDCIRNGGRVKTPGEEGLKDIRIIQAIYESGRTGKPVKLHT